MIESVPLMLLIGLATLVWLYIAARAITRAIVRSLSESRDARRKEDDYE